MNIARRPADGLNQGCLGTEKALFVGVQNANQTDLGQIQTLAEQIDTNETIKNPLPKFG